MESLLDRMEGASLIAAGVMAKRVSRSAILNRRCMLCTWGRFAAPTGLKDWRRQIANLKDWPRPL